MNPSSTSREDTPFSFETISSEPQIHVEKPDDEEISTITNEEQATKTPPMKRERSFRSFFKKKTPKTEEVIEELNSLTVNDDRFPVHSPLSPTFSDVSDISVHSEDEHSKATSSKLSAKWQIHKHNLDKNEETDFRSLEFSRHLAEKYYDAFNYDWQELAEHYVFGGLVKDIFASKGTKIGNKSVLNVYINWLLLGGDTVGDESYVLEPGFVENYDIYALEDSTKLPALLKFLAPLVKSLALFKQAVSFFKENTDNDQKLKENNDSVKILESVANKKGFPIPLSQALYANWLIQFGSTDNKFQDENILKYFRRSARNCLIISILNENHIFDELLSHLKKAEDENPQGSISSSISMYAPTLSDPSLSITNQELSMFITSFLKKDNQTALGLSLFGVANSYHLQKYFNKSINIFEIASNLTHDLDCCSMASVGLSNGYGFGKKHGKEFKFHRKKRLAHIYRIIKESGGKLDMGSSWAFKEKYN